jgi:hypothetical protein
MPHPQSKYSLNRKETRHALGERGLLPVFLVPASERQTGYWLKRKTYGMTGDSLKEYLNLSHRDALARDIWDARGIYRNDGLYGPEIRQSL